MAAQQARPPHISPPELPNQSAVAPQQALTRCWGSETRVLSTAGAAGALRPAASLAVSNLVDFP